MIPFPPLKGYKLLENTSQQEDYSIGRLVDWLVKESIMDPDFSYSGSLRKFLKDLSSGKDVLPVKAYEGIGDLFLATFKPEHRDLVSFVMPMAEEEGYKKTALMSLTEKLRTHYHYWISPGGDLDRVVVLWFKDDDFLYCPMPYFTEALDFGGKNYKHVMAIRINDGDITPAFQKYLDQPIG